ncbi:MAG: hypothetical protein C0200_05310 [Thermoproteota archaeon]|nr:MAG: hypothetical protein C0200_05310 [Candidatus Korarchaeota archaeon]
MPLDRTSCGSVLNNSRQHIAGIIAYAWHPNLCLRISVGLNTFIYSLWKNKWVILLEELLKRIVVDPQVMTGKPVIRGTRITVDLVLELLAAGMSPEEIAEDYKISIEDVRAALLYAARILGREEVLIVR